MAKTPVKFQKNQHRTVGGVGHTRYPQQFTLMVKFLKIGCVQLAEKVIKNNLRIIS